MPGERLNSIENCKTMEFDEFDAICFAIGFPNFLILDMVMLVHLAGILDQSMKFWSQGAGHLLDPKRPFRQRPDVFLIANGWFFQFQ